MCVETPAGAPNTPPDRPGVIAHPPFLFLGTLVAGILLDRIAEIPPPIPQNLRITGGALFFVAFALVIWGRRTMTRAGTNVNPKQPATRLVVTGPFRWSRNPLYLALTIAYVGLALVFDAAGALLFLLPLHALVHWGIVLREERYLEKKFGDVYLRYKAVTRRWI